MTAMRRNTTQRPGTGTSSSHILIHVVLIFFALSAVLPFGYMFISSFKYYKDLVENPGKLPKVWTLKNYYEILAKLEFPAAFSNSVISAGLVTVVALFTSAALGYVFAKYKFFGKEGIFFLLLGTMMVPFSVVLVPLYITITRMGLANQLGGIIVTGLWSSFGLFMMRQFIETIPSELLDAARIDGASEWRIFLQLIIPLSASPLAALGVFVFLGNWDSFLWPTVVLSSPAKQTVPLVLAGLRNLWWTRYEMWSAGSMLTVFPVMILYAIASRWFIRGIAMSGMKA